MPSTARFFRAFFRSSTADVAVDTTTYRRDGETLPATLYRPARAREPLPGWVTLHGLTYNGREHPSLQRLGRALAAAGNAVLVPDLPEWRALRVAPATTLRTIRSAVLELDSYGLTLPGRTGVMGFSFGATQALLAAAEPDLRGHLAGVAAWGGYADIRSVVRFTFFGEHALGGRTYRSDPDPYGRWILAGNYLRLLDEQGPDSQLANAILGLALEAGRRGVVAWDPALDPAKREAALPLEPGDREIFELIAPPAGARLAPDQTRRLHDLVERMLPLALAAEPLLDPADRLAAVPVPVFLAHGRHDRLIPWTEMVRLCRALPAERVVHHGLTTLFSHSTGRRATLDPRTLGEGVRFIWMIRRMLRLI